MRKIKVSMVLILLILLTTITSNAIVTDSLDFPIDELLYVPGSYKGRSFFYDSDHLGEDIDLPEGTSIKAIGNGILVWYYPQSDPSKGYGELVAVIEHDLVEKYNFTNAYKQKVETKKILSIYGHIRKKENRDDIEELTWKVGDSVQKGQIIGYINDDNHNGDGTEHLHFGIRLSDKNTAEKKDPGYWFRGYENATDFGRDFASGKEVINLLKCLSGTADPSVRWHPNGTLINTAENPDKYYILQEGYKKCIPNTNILRSWYDWSELITISKEEINAYPQSSNLYFQPGTLLRKLNDEKVYVVEDSGRIRWIKTSEIFAQLGYDWDNVHWCPEKDFNEGTTEELAPLDESNIYLNSIIIHPSGTLIKGSDEKVYLLKSIDIDKGIRGEKQHIYSPTVLISWFSWKDVIAVSDNEVNSYHTIPYPLVYQDGTLIKSNSKPEIYVIENGFLRHIANSEVFEAMGYQMCNVMEIEDEELNSLKENYEGLLGFSEIIDWNTITTPPSDDKSAPILQIRPQPYTLTAGQDHDITWVGYDDREGFILLDLFYSINDWLTAVKINAQKILTSIHSQAIDTYTWEVPNFSGDFSLRITGYDEAGNVGFDYTDKITIIENPSYPDLSITVLSTDNNAPNIGQQITITSTIINQGEATSNPTDLKYYFSTTPTNKETYLDKSSINPLSVNAQTTVTKAVTIPDITYGRVYIIAVVNPDNLIEESNTDNNTANISITIPDNEPPAINLLETKSQILKTDHEHLITFDVNDNVQVKSLDLYYSTDNGNTWNTIITGFVIGSNGLANAYNWAISQESITDKAKIKMTAWDTSDNQAEAITDTFTIIDGTSPITAIVSPNGGEVWDLGSQQEIIWSASSPNGIKKINLDLYYGDQSQYVAEETTNDGSCIWTLPSTSYLVTSTAKIRIQVFDQNWNKTEDWSDNYFTIRDPSIPPPPPWTMPERLTGQGIDQTVNHTSPQIAVDKNNHIHLVYQQEKKIVYKKWNGSAWSDAITVYEAAFPIESLQIVIDSNNNPHLIWQGYSAISDKPLVSKNYYEIYYTYHNGISWTAPINISDTSQGSDPTVSSSPGIAIDPDNNIHVAWCDGYSWNEDFSLNGEYNIYYKKRNFATGVWSQKEQLTNEGGLRPFIAADSKGQLHLVFFPTSSFDIYYLSWNSQEWSEPIEIISASYDENTNYFDDLLITTDSNDKVHLAWRNFFIDNTQKSWEQVLYSHYDSNKWTDLEEVSDSLSNYWNKSQKLVTDSLNRPHIIWLTRDLGDNSHWGINYRYKSSLGWSTRTQISLESQRPDESSTSLAISSDNHLHAVWTAKDSGNPEVFYNHADVSQDVQAPVVQLLTPSADQVLSINDSFDITWICNDDVDIAEVFLKYTIDDGENFTQIADNIENSGIHQWIVPNITSNTVQIWITAFDTAGNEAIDISDTFTITDQSPPIISLISPDESETVKAGSLYEIKWAGSDNVGISSTNLFYSLNEDISWTLIDAVQPNINSYSWTLPNKISSACKIKITGVDAEGNQTECISNNNLIITSNNNPPNTPYNPSPPEGTSDVSITPSLSWEVEDPDTDDIIIHDIYFGTSSNPPLVSEGQLETTYFPGILDHNKFYFWKVIVTDSHGTSSTSPTWSFVTEAEPVPISPSNLSASTVSNSQIDLSWDDNSDNELGFKIERKMGADGEFTQINIIEADSLAFQDKDLQPCKTYYYRIRAYNASGNSSYSNEVQATTLNLDPISDFVADPSESESIPITIQFTNNSTNATHCLWNFGDGNTSIEQDPNYTYTAFGDYTVSLTTSNNCGSYTKSINIPITNLQVPGDEPITSEENIPPTAACRNITIYLDSNGSASVTADQIDNGSTDNYGIDTISISSNQFTCIDMGDNEVTLTVIDTSGNTCKCTAIVTVIDNLPPAPDLDPLPDISGEEEVTITEFPTATDNCAGIVTATTGDPLTYSIKGIYIVTWNYEDGYNNIVTQTQTVIIGDVTDDSYIDTNQTSLSEDSPAELIDDDLRPIPSTNDTTHDNDKDDCFFKALKKK